MRATIERLGHHGDGVTEDAVFVSRALPGEIVEGKPDNGRIFQPRIISPSTERVAAPCRHYKGCGGCGLQHASDEFVRKFKLNVVQSALRARGLPAPLRRIHVSPPQSRRRATFSATRSKKGATVGFHAPAGTVIQGVPDCQLVRPALSGSLQLLEQLTIVGASRKSEIKFSVTETETGLDVMVSGGKPLELDLRQRIVTEASGHGLARLSWNNELLLSERKPVITFGGAPVTPPPGSFLQATVEGEGALRASVLEALGETRHAVVDLFSGIGTFALPASMTRRVHAVEGSAAALRALEEGWRNGSGLQKVTIETRDLFRNPLDEHDLSSYEAAIVDPPRAGAEAQSHHLARSTLSRVAFVSCNPVTFARDASILVEAGYRLEWIDVVDQFRWSAHVELAASFVRE